MKPLTWPSLCFCLCFLPACAPEKTGGRLLADPAYLDLGDVPVGKTARGGVRVLNVGPDTAEIHRVGLSPGAEDAWSLGHADAADLFVGASMNLVVRYTPIETGPSTAALEVLSEDPDAPLLVVPLFGFATTGPNGTIEDPSGGGGETGDGAGDDDTGDTSAPGDPHADGDGDGVTPAGGDCDDTDAAVLPGASEVCNGHDDDCDGVVDDLDADGDGHSPCDLGGDCDDTDAAAWPVFVDAAATGTATGTVDAPYPDIPTGLAHLDTRCREVVLAAGAYAPSVEWANSVVRIRGAARPEDVVLTPPSGARAFTVSGDGQLALTTLTLKGARLTAEDGGALFVDGGVASLSGVRLEDNTAPNGGAIATKSGTLTLSGCALTGNSAGDRGGAVYVEGGHFVDGGGSTWSGNKAHDGGALYLSDANVDVADATFQANAASGGGGAVLLHGGESLHLQRLRLLENTTTWRGGGLYVEKTEDPDGYVRNSVFAGNHAGNEGGGLVVTGWHPELVIANDTFVDNAAGASGGGVFVDAQSAGELTLWANIVAWSTGTSGLFVADGSGASVAYNLGYGTRGGAELQVGGGEDRGANFVGDPLFTRFSDDGDASDDTLTLRPGSPAIDQGPRDGTGPAGYTTWHDIDNTPNDLGGTGGQGG